MNETGETFRALAERNAITLQSMAQGGVRARRGRTDCGFCVSRIVSRAPGQHATLEVICDAVRAGRGDGVTLLLFLFQSPLLNRAIDLAKIVDAGILLGRCTGLDEVWNRDGGQEADDRDHDHDFNEGETELTISLDLHSFYFGLFICGRELRGKLVYQYDFVHALPSANRVAGP